MNILLRLQLFFQITGHYASYFLAYIFETIFFLIFVVISLIAMIYIFRKYMARLQLRIGPNRVGKFGLLQLIADALKLVGKESIIPKLRDDFAYKAAPYIVFIGLVVGFVIIPYGSFYWIGSLTITHSNVSLILFFGAIAMMPIGEVLAGISSHNKYAVIGAFRGIAKDVSFEVPMMISAVSLVMMDSALSRTSLNFETLVSTQFIPFGILQPLGLFVFMVAMIARSSYTPFDLSESDSEIVSGYSTEYSGMRFGLFYMGMFGSIFLGSLVVSLLYLGGFNGPYSSYAGFIYLLIKGLILVLISFLIWLSMPRIRVDRFINFGWKILLPISIINLIWAGFLTLGVIS
ncbi:NADH-quinone oxidoreductase subunit NuoH [Thermoplasma sp.]|uniref:NADH-quinone oxidoreductase subunit NuoH n=1 Tax=Thermoplasma sp. TaxID=1973142 RepID=UPI0012890CD7|nr:NADH-quinone oxidoreductase subunit NuoH [Thermoplasma sp.]KAA8923200.1 MAG: NADH-quinone oxidoreductase subunit NuoH [Thermoplasma sp.]